MIETIVKDRETAGVLDYERELPKNIDAVFDAFVVTLAKRQAEIFGRYGAFVSCNSICSTKGGPDGRPTGVEDSLQEAIESIGVLCYVEVVACYNPSLGHWYEFDIQWTDTGRPVFQRFFMDGTAIAVVRPVESFGQ